MWNKAQIIKHLDADNRKIVLIQLDDDETNLPQVDSTGILAPGSKAFSMRTGDTWLLNSQYEWEFAPWLLGGEKPVIGGGGGGGGVPDAPNSGLEYVRKHGQWNAAHFAEKTLETQVGDVEDLETTATTVVTAINEVNSKIIDVLSIQDSYEIKDSDSPIILKDLQTEISTYYYTFEGFSGLHELEILCDISAWPNTTEGRQKGTGWTFFTFNNTRPETATIRLHSPLTTAIHEFIIGGHQKMRLEVYWQNRDIAAVYPSLDEEQALDRTNWGVPGTYVQGTDFTNAYDFIREEINHKVFDGNLTIQFNNLSLGLKLQDICIQAEYQINIIISESNLQPIILKDIDSPVVNINLVDPNAPLLLVNTTNIVATGTFDSLTTYNSKINLNNAQVGTIYNNAGSIIALEGTIVTDIINNGYAELIVQSLTNILPLSQPTVAWGNNGIIIDNRYDHERDTFTRKEWRQTVQTNAVLTIPATGGVSITLPDLRIVEPTFTCEINRDINFTLNTNSYTGTFYLSVKNTSAVDRIINTFGKNLTITLNETVIYIVKVTNGAVIAQTRTSDIISSGGSGNVFTQRVMTLGTLPNSIQIFDLGENLAVYTANANADSQNVTFDLSQITNKSGIFELQIKGNLSGELNNISFIDPAGENSPFSFIIEYGKIVVLQGIFNNGVLINLIQIDGVGGLAAASPFRYGVAGTFTQGVEFTDLQAFLDRDINQRYLTGEVEININQPLTSQNVIHEVWGKLKINLSSAVTVSNIANAIQFSNINGELVITSNNNTVANGTRYIVNNCDNVIISGLAAQLYFVACPQVNVNGGLITNINKIYLIDSTITANSNNITINQFEGTGTIYTSEQSHIDVLSSFFGQVIDPQGGSSLDTFARNNNPKNDEVYGRKNNEWIKVFDDEPFAHQIFNHYQEYSNIPPFQLQINDEITGPLLQGNNNPWDSSWASQSQALISFTNGYHIYLQVDPNNVKRLQIRNGVMILVTIGHWDTTGTWVWDWGGAPDTNLVGANVSYINPTYVQNPNWTGAASGLNFQSVLRHNEAFWDDLVDVRDELNNKIAIKNIATGTYTFDPAVETIDEFLERFSNIKVTGDGDLILQNIELLPDTSNILSNIFFDKTQSFQIDLSPAISQSSILILDNVQRVTIEGTSSLSYIDFNLVNTTAQIKNAPFIKGIGVKSNSTLSITGGSIGRLSNLGNVLLENTIVFGSSTLSIPPIENYGIITIYESATITNQSSSTDLINNHGIIIDNRLTHPDETYLRSDSTTERLAHQFAEEAIVGEQYGSAVDLIVVGASIISFDSFDGSYTENPDRTIAAGIDELNNPWELHTIISPSGSTGDLTLSYLGIDTILYNGDTQTSINLPFIPEHPLIVQQTYSILSNLGALQITTGELGERWVDLEEVNSRANVVKSVNTQVGNVVLDSSNILVDKTATTTQTIKAKLESIDQNISAVAGNAPRHYIPYNFTTATPTNTQITNQVMTQLFGATWAADGHVQTEIPNGGRIINLFNNEEYVLNNIPAGPGGVPAAVFEWIDLGNEVVPMATNSALGIVKGTTITPRYDVDDGYFDKVADLPTHGASSVIYGAKVYESMTLWITNSSGTWSNTSLSIFTPNQTQQIGTVSVNASGELIANGAQEEFTVVNEVFGTVKNSLEEVENQIAIKKGISGSYQYNAATDGTVQEFLERFSNKVYDSNIEISFPLPDEEYFHLQNIFVQSRFSLRINIQSNVENSILKLANVSGEVQVASSYDIQGLDIHSCSDVIFESIILNFLNLYQSTAFFSAPIILRDTVVVDEGSVLKINDATEFNRIIENRGTIEISPSVALSGFENLINSGIVIDNRTSHSYDTFSRTSGIPTPTAVEEYFVHNQHLTYTSAASATVLPQYITDYNGTATTKTPAELLNKKITVFMSGISTKDTVDIGYITAYNSTSSRLDLSLSLMLSSGIPGTETQVLQSALEVYKSIKVDEGITSLGDVKLQSGSGANLRELNLVASEYAVKFNTHNLIQYDFQSGHLKIGTEEVISGIDFGLRYDEHDTEPVPRINVNMFDNGAGGPAPSQQLAYLSDIPYVGPDIWIWDQNFPADSGANNISAIQFRKGSATASQATTVQDLVGKKNIPIISQDTYTVVGMMSLKAAMSTTTTQSGFTTIYFAPITSEVWINELEVPVSGSTVSIATKFQKGSNNLSVLATLNDMLGLRTVPIIDVSNGTMIGVLTIYTPFTSPGSTSGFTTTYFSNSSDSTGVTHSTQWASGQEIVIDSKLSFQAFKQASFMAKNNAATSMEMSVCSVMPNAASQSTPTIERKTYTIASGNTQDFGRLFYDDNMVQTFTIMYKCGGDNKCYLFSAWVNSNGELDWNIK